MRKWEITMLADDINTVLSKCLNLFKHRTFPYFYGTPYLRQHKHSNAVPTTEIGIAVNAVSGTKVMAIY